MISVAKLYETAYFPHSLFSMETIVERLQVFQEWRMWELTIRIPISGRPNSIWSQHFAANRLVLGSADRYLTLTLSLLSCTLWFL